jgi:uncharacterized cupredoxin-like copper-binding protein
VVVLACIVAVVVAGCAGGARQVSSGPVVSVTERDFQISADAGHVAPGAVVLRIHNAGPDQHELIVVPGGSQGLPFRTDGFTVNEEAIQRSELGSIAPQRPGGTEDVRVHLGPGRYLLFCNMAGHFMSGMHAELVVR